MHGKTIILNGHRVRLEPLNAEHHRRLCEIGLEPEIWKWVSFPVTTSAEMQNYIAEALEQRKAGTGYPFVTVDKETNTVVGSTRFGNRDEKNKRVEIGYTWIHPQWQRTNINTEAKFLMLQYAFEHLGCRRVEFKTDSLNEKSRAALLRIGAKEGILRNHMVTSTERMRHSVYFSVIDTEWVTVKKTLSAKIASPTGNA